MVIIEVLGDHPRPIQRAQEIRTAMVAHSLQRPDDPVMDLGFEPRVVDRSRLGNKLLQQLELLLERDERVARFVPAEPDLDAPADVFGGEVLSGPVEEGPVPREPRSARARARRR